ncbi:MAG: hypothetical protein RTU30_06325 [Candidatus Thorarchaeota archaeon]
MVRQLVLNVLYKKSGDRFVSEQYETSVAVAFAIAEAQRGKRRISSFTPISVPYWIVQVSETDSILLSGLGRNTTTLEFSENKTIGSVKRIMSSETNEPKDIPEIVDKALEFLGNVEQSTHSILNLVEPGIITPHGHFFAELDPSYQLNRLEETIDSREALEISEQFQKLREEATTRFKALEEVQQLTKEHLGGQLRILENVSTSEIEKGDKRYRTQDEMTELKMGELAKKQNDSLYELQEKHKMDLRALTADLARSSSSIEGFFNEVLEKIQYVRVVIGQKGEKLTEALEDFDDLVKYLNETVPKYTDRIQEVHKKRKELISRAHELESNLAGERTQVAEQIEAEIREHRLRLTEFGLERSQKQNELEELKEQVKGAIARMERAIGVRLQELRDELNHLSVLILQNDSIPGLAPLTHIDIMMFVVKYNDDDIVFLTLGLSPEERLGATTSHRVLDQKFHELFASQITEMIESNPGFANEFQTLCNSGNFFTQEAADGYLTSGLNSLQARQMLEEGIKERLVLRWNEYRGKCPKCGDDVGVGAQFCAGCGAVLG